MENCPYCGTKLKETTWDRKFCPNCGTKLKETTWDRKFCPNCGIIEELESTENKEISYIG